MAKYPNLVMTDMIGPYWHDFDFATSGDAVINTDNMCLTGDSFIKKDQTTGSDCFYRVSQEAVKVIKVFLN